MLFEIKGSPRAESTVLGLFPSFPRRLYSQIGKNLSPIKDLFNPEYKVKTWLAYVLVILGIPATLGYHYYERSLGYWTPSAFRFSLCVVLLPILVLVKVKRWTFFLVLYWETALLIFFPLASTWLMLMNDCNKYWFSTYIMGMVFLGICTKYYMIPVHYIVGAGLATWLHMRYFHASPSLYADNWEAQSASILAAIGGNGIIMALEYAQRKARETTELRHIAERDKLRADAAEQRAHLITQANVELAKVNNQKDELIDVLKSYTRPSLVALFNQGVDPRTVLPSEKDFTVMSCDIRGYTALTESVGPLQRINLLNSYFSMMTDAVEEAGGEMDKFIGDAFMALFTQPEAAAKAALGCRLALQQYNRMMMIKDPSYITLKSGIGISKGILTHANIGSRKKMDFTVVGSAANISSRLEKMTKKYNVDVLVTEDIIQAMGDYPHCRWIDNVRARGSGQGLKIFELYGHQPADVIAYKDRTKNLLNKALQIYFNKGFRDAERMFLAFLEQSPPHKYILGQPMDRILVFWVCRCENLRKDPNGFQRMMEDWDGFHDFDE